jgi:hypothetical protein
VYILYVLRCWILNRVYDQNSTARFNSQRARVYIQHFNIQRWELNPHFNNKKTPDDATITISCTYSIYCIDPGGALPILLGTDVRLRFSKYPHLYIQYFWKPYPFRYFIWKSWPNHIYNNSVINVINAGNKFTTHWYYGMLNYLPINYVPQT